MTLERRGTQPGHQNRRYLSLNETTERGTKMKRLVTVAVGALLSISMIAVANAALAQTSAVSKQPQGIKNARKVMQARFDHEKMMQEVRKQAHEKRRLAQGVR